MNRRLGNGKVGTGGGACDFLFLLWRFPFFFRAMPVYEYQILGADGSEVGRFEIEQSANAPDLTAHPLSGQPVRRVFQAPNLAGQYNERRIRARVKDPENLSRLGFTRYEKDKLTGRYHKTAGHDAHAPESFGPGKTQQ
ncbi:MAG: hypothetical protein LBV54_01545 [Puniceicoccales bacterium]|nr:hypothetical protein [Puniceicoccales bacterium]